MPPVNIFFQKPFTFKTLTESVDGWLGKFQDLVDVGRRQRRAGFHQHLQNIQAANSRGDTPGYQIVIEFQGSDGMYLIPRLLVDTSALLQEQYR